MIDVGQMLERARRKRGISLETVESDLKIRKHYLIAIEAGRWEDLPGAAYAAGFLRSYGDYLGLSGEELVSEYKYWRKIQGDEDLMEGPPIGVFTRSKELQTDGGIFQLATKGGGKAKRRRQLRRGVFVLVIFFVALGAYVFVILKHPFYRGTIRSQEGPAETYEESASESHGGVGMDRVPESEVSGLAGSPGQGLAAVHPDASESTEQGWVEVKPAAPIHVEQSVTTDPPISLPDQVEAGVSMVIDSDQSQRDHTATSGRGSAADQAISEEPTVIVPSDTVHRIPPLELEERAAQALILEAHARGRCWIEVRADEKVVFSRIVEAGEHHIWTAEQEIRIRFGNAHVVELKLNGEDIGPAGKGVLTRVFSAES